jgi:hypothetical protein
MDVIPYLSHPNQKPMTRKETTLVTTIAIVIVGLLTLLGINLFINGKCTDHNQYNQGITEVHDFYICFGKFYPFTSSQREALRPIVVERLQQSKIRLEKEMNTVLLEQTKLQSQIPAGPISQTPKDISDYFSTVDRLKGKLKILDTQIEQLRQDCRYIGGTAAAAGFWREAVLTEMWKKPVDSGGGDLF